MGGFNCYTLNHLSFYSSDSTDLNLDKAVDKPILHMWNLQYTLHKLLEPLFIVSLDNL